MQWSRPVPSFRRKKPSGVRSPVMNGRSRSSTSLVMSLALSASVRATMIVGTPQTSAASRAASRLRIAACGRDQHLAAEMAALLLARQLVLEVHAGGARFDIGLHDLEAVERPAEAGFGVGDDRREPVALGAAFQMLDLVGALQRPVDLARKLRAGIRRIERLVRIHGAGGVGVGGDLPARKVDRLQAGADHLHGLVAGERAERAHGLFAVQQLPQLQRAAAGERVLDRAPSRAASARLRRRRAARCRRSGRSGPSPLVRSRSLRCPFEESSSRTRTRAAGKCLAEKS